MSYDLLVVGGGAAGLAAARAARRRGAAVALVSDGPLGGDCTFTGCVPSKTLIESARQGLDFEAAAARVRATVAAVAAGEDAGVLRAEGIDVIEGRARLAGRGRVQVGDRAVAARRVVIATGAGPLVPGIPGRAEVGALTNRTVFALESRPASLLVVGGGPIGVELGQAFARLGTAVTVVEAAGRLLPGEEPEASAVITGALAADGVEVRTGRQVTALSGRPGAVRARLDDATEVAAEAVLVAVGRRADTASLGLADAGVEVDGRGFVVTDRRLRTTAAGIYAAGDVTGRSMYTHAADEMGRLAAANALSRLAWRAFHSDAVPAVTYTTPEVARVGLTEGQAAAIPGARVAEVPLSEVDRAVTAGRTAGYVKLIVAPRRATRDLAGGRLVGATIVADPAGEMIAVPALALRSGMLPARLALTVAAYPTWSLGIRQAAAQLFVEAGGRRARPARPDPD